MKLNVMMTQKSHYGLLALALIVTQFFVACTGTQKSKKDIPTSYGVNTKSAMSNTEARLLYVDLYKTIAIREMERTGIPASIKLAQGVLESNAGRSELSSKYNNHFGIKCHSDWTGERFYKEDDDKDPVTGQLIKSCFRAYKAGEESFIAHSEFLRDPRKVNRYGFLFQLDPKDYVGWANGLERAGYATAQDYSEKLIRIIEDMQLSRYDQMTSSDVVNNSNRPNGNNNRPNDGFDNPNSSPNMGNTNNSSTGLSEGRVNDIRVLKVTYPLTLEQLAGRYDVGIKKLQDYNEQIGDGTKLLKQGSFIYLQKKRNNYSGSEKYHRVQQCETMYDISQKYGIKLSKLYRKNEMREGDQPQVGEKIILRRGLFQGWDMPALRDTFGEWRRCEMPIDTVTNRPPAPPTAGNRPPITNTGEFTFDISPGASGQPQSSYPTTTTGYPQTSYPQGSQGNYPQSSQPSSGTYYPDNNNNYPSSTTSYPSTGSNTTYYPSNPSSGTGTTYYPSTGANNYPTTDATSSYPSYPSKPSTQPSRPTTQPTKPATQPTTQPSAQPRPQPTGAVQYHTVSKGDTLWSLSKKYGLTVARIRELNSMTDDNIKIGQQLRVK